MANEVIRTRPLTADETERLLRNLVLALGVSGKDAALRAIVDVGGVGFFALADDDDNEGTK